MPNARCGFFARVTNVLQTGGRCFLAAYAPGDECLQEWSRSNDAPFPVHLEDGAAYQDHLEAVGLTVLHKELVNGMGALPDDRGAGSIRRDPVSPTCRPGWRVRQGV